MQNGITLRSPQNGDIVILREDNATLSRWSMGRTVAVHPGSDGLVQVVY